MRDWTRSEDERILSLLSEGKTRGQIAAEFGVTRNAICGKVHRLLKTTRPVMTPDEEPNEETIAAFTELEAGGGELFYGSAEAALDAILGEPDHVIDPDSKFSVIQKRIIYRLSLANDLSGQQIAQGYWPQLEELEAWQAIRDLEHRRIIFRGATEAPLSQWAWRITGCARLLVIDQMGA